MCTIDTMYMIDGSSQLVLVVKNPPANAGDLRLGLDHGVGKIPCQEGRATCSSILAWRIPWTEG